jgi:transposase
VEVGQVEVAQDDQEIIARVAALDIGKAEVVCCVRVPGVGPRARRMQEVRTYSTMTRSLLAMADWLTGLGVTQGCHGSHRRLLAPAVLLAGEQL